MNQSLKNILIAIGSFLAFIVLLALSPIVIIYKLIVLKKDQYFNYFKKIANACTQFGGSVLYSTEDWTTSSYTHYLAHYENNMFAKMFEKVINILASSFEDDHCFRSYNRERIELNKKIGEK